MAHGCHIFGIKLGGLGISNAKLTLRLLEELVRLDDGSMPIAELNRRLGMSCERLRVRRPSYERVRMLVHEARAVRRPTPSTVDVLLDVAWRARSPMALLDHIAGIPVPPLR